jgi:hypothetical protein
LNFEKLEISKKYKKGKRRKFFLKSAGSPIWNNLPLQIRNANSFYSFKSLGYYGNMPFHHVFNFLSVCVH